MIDSAVRDLDCPTRRPDSVSPAESEADAVAAPWTAAGRRRGQVTTKHGLECRVSLNHEEVRIALRSRRRGFARRAMIVAQIGVARAALVSVDSVRPGVRVAPARSASTRAHAVVDFRIKARRPRYSFFRPRRQAIHADTTLRGVARGLRAVPAYDSRCRSRLRPPRCHPSHRSIERSERRVRVVGHRQSVSATGSTVLARGFRA